MRGSKLIDECLFSKLSFGEELKFLLYFLRKQDVLKLERCEEVDFDDKIMVYVGFLEIEFGGINFVRR